jgi:hypothetical protein
MDGTYTKRRENGPAPGIHHIRALSYGLYAGAAHVDPRLLHSCALQKSRFQERGGLIACPHRHRSDTAAPDTTSRI